jgi:hypothetical protein
MNVLPAPETADLRAQSRKHIEDRGLSGAAVTDQPYFHFSFFLPNGKVVYEFNRNRRVKKSAASDFERASRAPNIPVQTGR